MMSAPLSKELRKEMGTRNVPVRKGDTVKVISGQFKDKSGKVTGVSLAKLKIQVAGMIIKRGDSTESNYPISPSNVMITKLNLSDKKRQEKFDKLKNSSKQSKSISKEDKNDK